MMNVSKRTMFGIALIGAFLLVWLFAPSLLGPWRVPFRYLVPEGYVGPLRLDYDVPGAPLLRIVGGHYEVHFDQKGMSKVSTPDPDQSGWAWDQYFYVSPDGSRKPIDRSLIQGEGYGNGDDISGGKAGVISVRHVEEFHAFIGTEADYNRYWKRITAGG